MGAEEELDFMQNLDLGSGVVDKLLEIDFLAEVIE